MALRLLLWGHQHDAGTQPTMERRRMSNLMISMTAKLQTLLKNEEGQDLVEYGLVVALVAFGAVAAMQALGTEISKVFSQITSVLSSSIS